MRAPPAGVGLNPGFIMRWHCDVITGSGIAAMMSRRQLGVAAAAALAMPCVRPARAAQRLRLGVAQVANSHYGAAATALADGLRAGTDGRVQVEVFTDGALGSEEAMLAGVRAGTLDLTIVASGLLGTYAPEVGLLDLPFLFRDAAHARAVLDGPVGQAYAAAAAAQGVPVLAWAENGVRHLTANRPVRTAADLRGLKLRIMPAPLLLEAFRAMGADAASLSFPLVYEALRVGKFEAEENPIPIIIQSRFYEVQSHLILTGHTYSAACIAASPDLLEDLGPADRRVLADAARAGVAKSREFVTAAEVTGLARLRDGGMTVITDPDRASFVEAAAAAEAGAALRFGADRIARLRGAA
jgi:tripartite ATP-independent transporter DctP family solute receptor